MGTVLLEALLAISCVPELKITTAFVELLLNTLIRLTSTRLLVEKRDKAKLPSNIFQLESLWRPLGT